MGAYPDSTDFTDLTRCENHHQRVRRVEARIDAVIGEVAKLRAAHQDTAQRVVGLTSAHEATLLAVRANTDAVQQMAGAVSRIDERLEKLFNDQHTHMLDNEKDKRGLVRVSLWLFGTSASALLAIVLWVFSNWEDIIKWLASHNLWPK